VLQATPKSSAGAASPTSSCDVAVIGAGMSGLVAGALLSKAGLDVLVCDPQTRPGGYLAGFRRKQFIFDSAIHWLNQCGPGGTVRRVLSFIGEGAPECAPLRRIRRYKGQSFDELLTDDPEELKQDWLARYPGDREGIERFFQDAREIGQRMTQWGRLLRTPSSMNPLELVRFGIRMGLWSLPFRAKYRWSAREGLDHYFRSEEIKRVFATERDFMSIIVPIGWAYHQDFQSAPPGGSQSFPRWLQERIEGAGSRVLLGRGVRRVELDRGRVAGIVLEPKPRRQIPEELVRSRWVVATNDVLTLFRHMLPAGTLPPARLSKLERMELYSSSVTISLGLDCPPEELGFGEEMLILTRDDVAREHQNCGDPSRAAITILAPSVRDPSLAPAGKGTLTIYIAAEIEYGDHWKTGGGLERGRPYRRFKEAYAEEALARVEEVLAIRLREHIEVLDIATPVTHWRYTGNHRGSLMGGRPTSANMRNRVARYRTPVKGLLLGGQWAEYGGGVPVATRAGANSALLVLKQADRREFRRLRDALDGR